MDGPNLPLAGDNVSPPNSPEPNTSPCTGGTNKLRSINNHLGYLCFFFIFGLATMIAASVLIYPGHYIASCVLAFGWLLVVALLAVSLWVVIYAPKRHKGRFSESFESLENGGTPGVPPILPPKDPSPPLAPQLPSQPTKPPPPQGYAYASYPSTSPPPPGAYTVPPGFVLVPIDSAGGAGFEQYSPSAPGGHRV
jgi:hypothetical protein